MSVSVGEIVRRTISHASRIAEDGRYEWPTARVALKKILADLEVRGPNDPALEPLRQYIGRSDRDWNRKNEAKRS